MSSRYKKFTSNDLTFIFLHVVENMINKSTANNGRASNDYLKITFENDITFILSDL